MFAYIKGVLDYKGTEFIVVEANGVGYKIITPLLTLENIGQKGDEVKVYTHFHVREDIMNLYGFSTLEELELFKLLISVSGIGPKVAISLISTLSPTSFSLAVITDDTRTIMKAPGVGKKTAQRIILELKDKIKQEQLSSIDADENPENLLVDEADTAKQEAVSALIVLGYSSSEARKAVSSVYTKDENVESLIKKALKFLAR